MKDFDKIIWRDGLTVVDFFATWCRPCQLMSPILDRVSECMKGRVDVYKMNIESAEDSHIIQRYNIKSVPTIVIFRHGEVLWRKSGLMSFEALKHEIEALEKREVAGNYI